MNRSTGLRSAARMIATRVGPAACISGACIMTQGPHRLDAMPSTAIRSHHSQPPPKISPKAVQQLSKGSIAGFCTGVVVALFSRTLAFLGSFMAITVYAASRYGVDLPRMMGIKRLVNSSGWWNKLERSPWFTASFALTFSLAAFVRL